MKGLGDDYRRLRIKIQIEVEADHAKRLNSVLYLIEKCGSLKKSLGYLVKIPPMGHCGPTMEDNDTQCNRA